MRPTTPISILLGLPLLMLALPAQQPAPAPRATPDARAADCDKLMKELSECAANTDQEKRLAAYDELAKSLGITPRKPGSWSVAASTSPVDDTKSVTLGLGAEKEVSKPGGGSF